MNSESIADRLIREAMERGDFDDLPGAGKPIPDLDKPYDPHWWVKSFLARERSADAVVAARDAIHAKLGTIWQLESEQTVRTRIDQINRELAALNETSGEGFESFDVDDTVAAWRHVFHARLRQRSGR